MLRPLLWWVLILLAILVVSAVNPEDIEKLRERLQLHQSDWASQHCEEFQKQKARKQKSAQQQAPRGSGQSDMMLSETARSVRRAVCEVLGKLMDKLKFEITRLQYPGIQVIEDEIKKQEARWISHKCEHKQEAVDAASKRGSQLLTTLREEKAYCEHLKRLKKYLLQELGCLQAELNAELAAKATPAMGPRRRASNPGCYRRRSKKVWIP